MKRKKGSRRMKTDFMTQPNPNQTIYFVQLSNFFVNSRKNDLNNFFLKVHFLFLFFVGKMLWFKGENAIFPHFNFFTLIYIRLACHDTVSALNSWFSSLKCKKYQKGCKNPSLMHEQPLQYKIHSLLWSWGPLMSNSAYY